VNPGQFAIGDTLHSGAPVRFLDLPRFPAEHFGRVRLQDQRYKQFDDGLQQLEEEGLMQVFFTAGGRREPIVGVVGALQFDVIASRLRTEYSVEVVIEPTSYAAARWLADPAQAIPSLGGGAAVATDRQGRRLILFASKWEVEYFERQYPPSSCSRSRRSTPEAAHLEHPRARAPERRRFCPRLEPSTSQAGVRHHSGTALPPL
jgi:peptide chain release factor 3